MMCQTGGGALERVQIFILAERLKIEFFLHYQVKKAVGCKPFVNLVYTLTSFICPHDSTICDLRLSYFKTVTVELEN